MEGAPTIRVEHERDMVAVRHHVCAMARDVGFEVQDQNRIATALSEIVRNALVHAGGGLITFELQREAGDGTHLQITVADRGPGIANLQEVLDGTHRSADGTGGGILAARRLMDRLEIQSDREAGTRVILRKTLPKRAHITPEMFEQRFGAMDDLMSLERRLEAAEGALVASRTELLAKDEEIAALNAELESTNRGVVALYAELDDQAEQLRRASELKSRFLSNMSHEFRTPLNSMLAISQLLLGRIDGELTMEQEKQVTFIRTSARNLTEMVDDLLDIAKVEAGKFDVRVQQFSVIELLATLRGVLKPLQTSSRVELIFDEVVDPPKIRSDEGKVSQILRNLVSNALKYTEAGTVRVSTSHDDRYIRFAVADTGIGIHPHDLERMFEEFVQLEHRLQSKVRGTGLGLSLSRRLAGLLGGDLSVRSEVGVGSTFTLTIPLRPPEDAEAKVRTGQHRPILVIDDEEASRYVIRQFLGLPSDDLIEAADGEEGLQRVRMDRPSLIFLDLRLPRMSGLQVLERLAADPEAMQIPVVVVTSSVLAPEDVQKLSHARAILSKAAMGRESLLDLVATLALKE